MRVVIISATIGILRRPVWFATGQNQSICVDALTDPSSLLAVGGIEVEILVDRSRITIAPADGAS